MGRAKGNDISVHRRAGRSLRDRLKTSEDVQRELRAFIGDRQAWPTDDEFKKAGQGELLAFVEERGGVAIWRSALGFLTEEEEARRERERLEGEVDVMARTVPRILGFFPTDDELLRAASPALADRVREIGAVEVCRQHRVSPSLVMSGAEYARRQREQQTATSGD